MTDKAEFSVVWFDPDEKWVYEKRWIDAGDAVKLAFEMTSRPAAKLGIFARIIIVDGGDNTVFEWKHEHGVTFPQPEKNQAS